MARPARARPFTITAAVASTTSTLAANAAHLARLLSEQPYPGKG